MVRRRWTLLALVVALGALGAACDGYGGGDGATTPAATTGEATGEPTGDGGNGGGTSVELQNFEFQPAEIVAVTGTSVSVLNVDRGGHTFTVDGTDIDVTIDGGQSTDIPIEIDPGDYQLYCRFHGSPGSGMSGTLTVT